MVEVYRSVLASHRLGSADGRATERNAVCMLLYIEQDPSRVRAVALGVGQKHLVVESQFLASRVDGAARGHSRTFRLAVDIVESI